MKGVTVQLIAKLKPRQIPSEDRLLQSNRLTLAMYWSENPARPKSTTHLQCTARGQPTPLQSLKVIHIPGRTQRSFYLNPLVDGIRQQVIQQPALKKTFRFGGIRRYILSDTKVEVKLNSSGIRAVLQSQFMMDALMAEAEKYGEIDNSFVGFDRCHVIVKENEDAD